MPDAHARHAALYLPGSEPRALAKARGLRADALVFGQEHAAAPGGKPRAGRSEAPR